MQSAFPRVLNYVKLSVPESSYQLILYHYQSNPIQSITYLSTSSDLIDASVIPLPAASLCTATIIIWCILRKGEVGIQWMEHDWPHHHIFLMRQDMAVVDHSRKLHELILPIAEVEIWWLRGVLTVLSPTDEDAGDCIDLYLSYIFLVSIPGVYLGWGVRADVFVDRAQRTSLNEVFGLLCWISYLFQDILARE